METALILREAVEAYCRLERDIGRHMTAWCAPVCARCPTPCCRAEICEETRRSAWLIRIRRHSAPRLRHTDRGWLGRGECRLPAGRPPVCYEYFCATLLAGCTEEKKAALSRLGKLVSAAGFRALGQRHLVELNEADLQRVKPERLLRRIRRAREEFADLIPALPHAFAPRETKSSTRRKKVVRNRKKS